MELWINDLQPTRKSVTNHKLKTKTFLFYTNNSSQKVQILCMNKKMCFLAAPTVILQKISVVSRKQTLSDSYRVFLLFNRILLRSVYEATVEKQNNNILKKYI